MSFFQEIDGEAAVIVENGIYRQVALYRRDNYLFAKYAGGFIRLNRDGATSKASGKARWDYLTVKTQSDELGRLTVKP